MSRRFAGVVLAAMAGGVLAGGILHARLDARGAAEAAQGLGLVTDVFLRLIRLIIGPLVLTTLVSGVARLEGAAAIGRLGARTVGWFLAASLVSLALGMAVAHLVQPGAGLHLNPGPAVAQAPEAALTLQGFLTRMVPTSVVDALARNDILQIVVFALLAGAAMSALGEKVAPLLGLVDQVAAIMLRITGYVMAAAPLAVFAAMAAAVVERGFGVLWGYARFIGGFYLGLATLWALLLGAAALIAGRKGLGLLAAVREPLLLAFSTTSSEVAYPKLLERLTDYGVPRRIAGFVLPLGYSFNLDGAMMYAAFALLFIAQAFDVPLSLGQELVMLLTLLISTKGLAGVPRAIMVVLAGLLASFHLPAAGLALVLAVDHVLDMGRAATNVLGNAVAALAVSRWEPGAEADRRDAA